MARLPKFKVRSRGKNWIVEIGASVSKNGKRQRLSFKTKREADARAVKLREEHFRFGVAAHKLPHDLQVDAVKAAAILEPYGVTLGRAAEHFAEWRESRSRSIEFYALFELYLRERELADSTLRDYRQTANRLRPHLGGRLVCDIGANDIREAFDVEGLKPSRRNAFRRALSAAWNFAIKRELASLNPLEKVETARVEKSATEILKPEKFFKLMQAAQKYEGGSMLAYFAVCTFAGVRPAEARRLAWGDVDFGKGYIYVSPGKAKTRGDRYVDIEPSLASWLGECPRKEGRLCPFISNEFNDRFDAVRELAGVKENWPSDVMRHSYCSYWLGLHGDQDRLVEMAGHSIQVNLKHYRRATTKEEATAFWSILPEG